MFRILYKKKLDRIYMIFRIFLKKEENSLLYLVDPVNPVKKMEIFVV